MNRIRYCLSSPYLLKPPLSTLFCSLTAHYFPFSHNFSFPTAAIPPLFARVLSGYED
jgi:hypothetical protein